MAERPSRRRVVTEVAICAVLVAAIGVFGLWKMDYLGSATAVHVRMTDNSRSAYVAKNLVEGKGYTTDELPAFLLDFYDHSGKLHQDHWPNADRFPLTTYAIAALYLVTGSTSWELGILGYNLICFVAFFTFLFWLARTVWHDKWAAVATMTIALLHPLAYVYPLYMKDADMLLLTAGVLATSYRYFSRPPQEASLRTLIGLGSFLALLFLDRPNVGGAFILYFALVIVRRWWVERRSHGAVGALRAVARREGIAVLAIVIWCLPFVIHSLVEWGSPLFTANAMYQRPLGTRFAMETDTWYKYSEPGQTLTLGTLAHQATGQLLSKFTSSWLATLKILIRSFAIELVLGLGLVVWLARRARGAEAEGAATDRAIMRLAKMVGFAVLVNFALLPLYGYQNYPYRHYLSFFLPLIWLLCGRAAVLIVDAIRPTVSNGLDRLRANPRPWILLAVVGVLLWNLGAKSQDENEMFTRTANFIGTHWLSSSILLAVALCHRYLFRPPYFPRAIVAFAILVLARFQPYNEIKSNNLNWFPADTKVWDALRERKGLVMSFALQGEVNWVSDRRNIPAPELAMHVYSFLFDHQLEVEDVYIESAETMIGPWDGPFYAAAPGFESYARLERYQAPIPGYQIVFHSATTKNYPKYRFTRPRPKASTVYRLVDREAVRAMGRSPTRIALGNVEQAIYTAYGWGDYYAIDGRPVVAATDFTHERYLDRADGLKPWEDTSVTFFLDDRRPASVDLEIYAVHATTLQFYWNVDLYAYDSPSERKARQVGTYAVTQPGWQTVHLEIPPGVTRKGLNKLGFRSSEFGPVTMCPKSYADATCAAVKLLPTDDTPFVVHDDHVSSPEALHVSVFAGSLDFHYGDTALPATNPR